MLNKTPYSITQDQLKRAQESLPEIDERLALNKPTGSFFNDPWEIKPEFRGTVWEEILDCLQEDKGEARLIKLIQGESYASHADIDDRWHLSLTGDHSYLIDLEQQRMFPIQQDCQWYSMNAGIRHTAANFGSCDRIQLVVRKLLPTPKINNPITISMKLKTITEDRRFIFDDVMSPWLNFAYKKGIIDNFDGKDLEARFTLESDYLPEVEKIAEKYFTVTVV